MSSEAKVETFDRFGITGGKGFFLQFANGWSISVQFGPGNYASCEGGRWGSYGGPQKAAAEGGLWSANSAEIAVFLPESRQTAEVCGRFLTGIDGDDVSGWTSADAVAKIMGVLVGFTPETPDDEARSAVQAEIEAGRE